MAVCAQGRGWDWGVRSGADDDQDDDDDDQDDDDDDDQDYYDEHLADGQ